MAVYDRDQTLKTQPFPLLLLPAVSSLSICHLPLHPALIHPGGTKPPNLTFSVTLIFIHLILHHLCLLLACLSLLQNSSYWLSKDAFILIVFWLFFLLSLSSPSHFPKPVGEVWYLSQPFSFCACTLSTPRSSQCNIFNPVLNLRPRHIDPSTWWAAVPEDHVLTQNPPYGLYNLSIYWKDGTCQASINFLLDVNFLTEIRYFDETFL